jgi:hypothetical protein
MIRLMIGCSSRVGAVRRTVESGLKAAVTAAGLFGLPGMRFARRAGLDKGAEVGKGPKWA